MSMPVAPGVAVGTGQPTRADFESPAYQAQLRPGQTLDIPKQSVPGGRQHPKEGEDLSRRTGWQRQDDVYAQGERNSDGAAGWQKFSGNTVRGWGGLNRGAVKVDTPNLGPSTPGESANITPHNWAEHAAKFEEKFRQVGSQVGLDTDLRLPGDSPQRSGPKGTGRRNQRRSYTLK